MSFRTAKTTKRNSVSKKINQTKKHKKILISSENSRKEFKVNIHILNTVKKITRK